MIGGDRWTATSRADEWPPHAIVFEDREMKHRLALATSLALAGLLMSAGAAAACLPYTHFNDQFGLERGIQWAFEGRVVREMLYEGTDRPEAVVIRVDRTLAGSSAGSELTIRQDGGCDGFWYRPGDRVIVAVPLYPWPLREPSPKDRIRLPFDDVTNYDIPVWVLDGERVVPVPGFHTWPAINGTSPTTRTQLVVALIRLPDTSISSVAVQPRGQSLLVPALVGACSLAAAAWLLRGRFKRTAA